MSTFAFRPKGGMEGISVTKAEMMYFSKFIVKTEYINDYIPLPNVTMTAQAERIAEANEENSDGETIYWENEYGSHGWCNSWTGRVVQWG